MKKLYTLLFACLSLHANAQYRFQHLYGGVNQERAQTVFETTDNKYLLSGVTTSYGQGGAEAIFIKNDNQGQIIWSKVYGSTDQDNAEYSIETNDLGYLGLGTSTVPLGGGYNDAWIYKTDTAGVLMWSKAYGNPGANDGFLRAINTFDGGFTFVGYTYSIGGGTADVLLVHTDANGDTLFTKSFGSIEIETGKCVIQTADSGYVICGRQQTFPNGSAESDGLIIKTDRNGDMLWANLYGDSLWEEFQSVIELPNGNLAIAGSTVSFGQGNYDILLMIADSAGTPINSFAYGGINSDASYDLHLNTDNSIVLSGYTESFGYGHSFMGSDSTNIFLLKTDTTGQVIWMVSYGDGLMDEGYLSAKSSDGGYMIGGFTNAYTFSDSAQMLFVKTDTLGFSGCHEELVTPLTESGIMPFRTSGFIQSSGLAVTVVNPVETSITTVNNDACLYASTNNLQLDNSVDIYPVPFNSELNLDLSNISYKDCRLKIVNSNGQIVYIEDNFSSGKINTTNFSPGIYFVVLSTDNQIKIQKAIKIN